MSLDDYVKKALEIEDTPDEAIENMDAAAEMAEMLMIPYGIDLPEKDTKKYVSLAGKIIYYPPKDYEGKELTAVAFIDMLKRHKLVPITVGNLRMLVSWETARDMFGYSVLFKHLMDAYHIIPAMSGD